MDKNEMLKSLKSMKSKLMATISMLLVSALVLTNVTYAWFVLSTAPEVSGVATTSGSNGALEIALQSTDSSSGTPQKNTNITNGVGDSSALATQSVTDANKTWGNIVDLTEGYGLEGITLYPARLNIDKATNYVNIASYLAVPQYGTDGRVSALKDVDKTHYVETAGVGAFEGGTNYGVNVLGFVNEMGDLEAETVTSYFTRETVRLESVNKVKMLRNSLRDELEETVESNSAGLVSLMFKTLNPLGSEWTELEIQTVKNLVAKLDAIVTKSAESLRWALLAYAVSDVEHYTPNVQAELLALGDIYRDFLTMELSTTDENKPSIMGIAEANGYTELAKAVDTLEKVQVKMKSAKDYLEADNIPFAGLELVSAEHTYLMCGTKDSPERVDDGIEKNFSESRFEDVLAFFGAEEMADSGLFPAMASIMGDYSAEIVAYVDENNNFYNEYPQNAEFATKLIYHMQTTSKHGNDPMAENYASVSVQMYDENTNVGVLKDVHTAADAREAEGEIPMSTIRSDVTAYGYSVDLAFRASESGDLVLQQKASSRVVYPYEDPQLANKNLQGGGSTMSFEIYGDMTSEQVERLVKQIYIVLMNTDTGEIYAVATADQVEVVLEQVTAALTLYEIDESAMDDAGDGILRLDEDPIKNNLITRLVKDQPTYITAVVYLNGDTVSSSDVATRGLSLVGSINMQFALDGITLRPMDYDEFYQATTATTHPPEGN